MMTLKSIIYVETLGLQRLTNAYGLLSLLMGIGVPVGTPLLGMIKNVAGSYIPTFVLSGVFMLFCSILLFILPNVKKWEERKFQTNI
jgi:MCP family monocarboxylic acid transporter-like MFS transporter 14